MESCAECRKSFDSDDMEYDRCEQCFNEGFELWLKENNYEDGRWCVTEERTQRHKVEDDYYLVLDERYKNEIRGRVRLSSNEITDERSEGGYLFLRIHYDPEIAPERIREIYKLIWDKVISVKYRDSYTSVMINMA